ERHARALIKLKEEAAQLEVLQQIIEHELNVKETEQLIKKMFEQKEKPKQKKPRLKGVNKDIRIAMNTIRQSLNMVSDTGIDVSSDEEDHDDYVQITIKIPKHKNEHLYHLFVSMSILREDGLFLWCDEHSSNQGIKFDKLYANST